MGAKSSSDRMHFGRAVHMLRDDLLRRVSQKSIADGEQAALITINVPWSWTARKLLNLLFQYPGGLTLVIFQSELEKQWASEDSRRDLGRSKQYTSLASLTASRPAVESMVFECTTISLTYSLCFLKRLFRITDSRSIVKRNSGGKKDGVHPQRLLPTEFMVPILSLDSKFDQEFLEENFSNNLKDITLHGIETGVGYNIILKILSIEAPEPASGVGRQLKQTILLSDSIHCRAKLILWDRQTALATLIRKNDSIAIRLPFLSALSIADPDIIQMEYGSVTSIFLIPVDASKEVEAMASLATQAHSNSAAWTDMPRDENGMTDFEWYPEPLDLQKLPFGAYNITLLGTIILVFNNDTEIASNRAQTRHGIRIANDTGICDITLWSESAVTASKLEVGHLVLLERLATYKDERNHIHVIGSPEHGTVIRSVSQCYGALSSPAISAQSSIQQIISATSGLFYCFAIISGWPLGHSYEGTSLVHSDCRKPVIDLDDMPFCSMCSNYVESTEYAFDMKVQLDDGTGTLDCILRDAAAVEALQSSTTALQFAALSPDLRADILNDAVGMHVLCAITVYKQGKLVFYRIDQIDTKPNIMLQIKTISEDIKGFPRVIRH
ncbi:hypothetical protein BASA61_004354 [Batrachochytrium salamandrivorans]|nr:hypothetical protein BASA61_004354 [Batrachochytrium salamandrivorans]